MGPNTGRLIERILLRREYMVQGYRSCLGILRLEKMYGRERLESACARAIAIGALSYKSVASILKNNLDRERMPEPQKAFIFQHENIRGEAYFSNTSTTQENTSC